MKRLGWALWCAVLLAGCTVPDILDLEKDKPFACDVAHPCADGYRCAGGVCVAQAPGDGGTVLADRDGDGHDAPSSGGDDCDDALADVHPGAAEACNGRDDDCDGERDEGFELGLSCDAAGGCQGAWACDGTGGRTCEQRGATPWFPDGDGDSYGARDATPVWACLQPVGHVTDNADCDDSTRQRRPGALELCNAVDEDCDGDPANGFNLDAACTEGPCSGVRVCVADGGAECSAQPLSRFRDSDNDGFGARNTAPVVLCQPPDGGYAVDAGDCDDTHPSRYPGAPERCNGMDDNCDSVSDDTAFSLGAGCTPDGGCTGARACDGDGGVTCHVVIAPTPYYPDEDLDSFGDANAPVPLCSPPSSSSGLIARGDDCDDGNPFSYTGATELCDAQDNNCNGSVDEVRVCPADAAWTPTTVGSTSRTWHRAALWGEGNLWVVGSGGGRVERPAGASGYTLYESSCPGDWYSVWADPSSGRAYLGGAGGRLATQESRSSFCSPAALDTSDSVTGLWGTRGGELLGVSLTVDLAAGRFFSWDGSGVAQGVGIAEPPLYSLHGLGPELLFAVGGPASDPRVYRYHPTYREWRRDTLSTSGLDHLRDVHVVHSKLAYAVGHNGGVARWNGTSWQRMSGPNTSTDLEAVLAFGTSSVYVASAGGSIYRFDGTSWQQLRDFNIPLWDIVGTGPDNIWVVGDRGLIIHWPR